MEISVLTRKYAQEAIPKMADSRILGTEAVWIGSCVRVAIRGGW